jgi:hypothetical protein
MRKLDRGQCAAFLDETGYAPKRLNLLVPPKTEIAVRNSAALLDRRRYTENDARTADRKPCQMREMPIIRQSIARGILKHRRNHDPIAGADAP